MIRDLVSICALSCIAIGCSDVDIDFPVGDPDHAVILAEGEAIVNAQCLACHGLSNSLPGPNLDAPPLSTVLETYSEDALSDDFRMGIQLGHPDMPAFDFTVRETDAIIAFLRSIRRTNVTVVDDTF